MPQYVSPDRIPHGLLEEAILWETHPDGGRGIESLTTREVGEETGARYKGTAAGPDRWHRLGDLEAVIATRLGIDPDMVADGSTDDFHTAVLRQVARLHEKGAVEKWKVGNRLVVRGTGPAPRDPYPTAGERILPPVEITGTTQEMASTFGTILRDASKDNTYKFALARAILDHCWETPDDDDQRYIIQYDYLAEKFLRYYWHQVCRFKIKQDFHTTKIPYAVNAIRDIFRGDSPPTYKQTDPDRRTRAKQVILADVFGKGKKSQVVPKFQNIKIGGRTRPKKVFYEYDNDRRYIRLRPRAFDFFKKYNGVLFGMVLSEWAKFLERANHNLPRLVAKIEAKTEQRSDLGGMREKLLKYEQDCFYCEEHLDRARIRAPNFHVDHFIPWSYMFDDDIWNLVLACPKCNSRKSNSLPEGFTDKLIDRNRGYYDVMGEMRRSLDMLDARRSWQTEIRNYYSTCLDYGFGTITRAQLCA